jgi:hypothetical protein
VRRQVQLTKAVPGAVAASPPQSQKMNFKLPKAAAAINVKLSLEVRAANTYCDRMYFCCCCYFFPNCFGRRLTTLGAMAGLSTPVS